MKKAARWQKHKNAARVEGRSYQIFVTKADIENGVRGCDIRPNGQPVSALFCGLHCAVALAVSRAVGVPTIVWNGRARFTPHGQDENAVLFRASVPLPEHAQNKISDYDAGKQITPFRFPLLITFHDLLPARWRDQSKAHVVRKKYRRTGRRRLAVARRVSGVFLRTKAARASAAA